MLLYPADVFPLCAVLIVIDLCDSLLVVVAERPFQERVLHFEIDWRFSLFYCLRKGRKPLLPVVVCLSRYTDIFRDLSV